MCFKILLKTQRLWNNSNVKVYTGEGFEQTVFYYQLFMI